MYDLTLALRLTALFAIVTLLSPPAAAYELYRSSLFPAPVQEKGSAAPPVAISPFAYDATKGPLSWYGLNSSWALCDTGTQQSPIDILPSDSTVKQVSGTSVKVDIPSVDSALIENVGPLVEVVTNGTLQDAEGTKYSLVQFHYHTPGEHRFNSEWMAMELHFVFETPNAKFAILTYTLDLSATAPTDPLSAAVFAATPKVPSPGDSAKTGPLNFAPLLAHFRQNKVYQYIGGITSPPCNEDVLWLISAEPLPLSVADFKQQRSWLKFNARYTQDAPGTENLLKRSAMSMVKGGLVDAAAMKDADAKNNGGVGREVDGVVKVWGMVLGLGWVMWALM